MHINVQYRTSLPHITRKIPTIYNVEAPAYIYAGTSMLYNTLRRYQTLISTSTPLGSSSFIRASTVFSLLE